MTAVRIRYRWIGFIISCGWYALYAQPVQPVYHTSFEKNLIKGITSKTPLQFTVLQSLRIAEGNTDSALIFAEPIEYQEVIRKISERIASEDDNADKAELIFDALHSKLFKVYHPYALSQGVFQKGYYNSAVATALYYDLCKRFNVPVTIHKTSAHFFFSLDRPKRPISIEIVSPDGFDFKPAPNEFRAYLFKYYALNNIYFGPEAEEEYFNQYIRREPARPEEIIGFSYYLDASSFSKEKDNFRSINAIEKALIIQPENEYYRSLHSSLFQWISTEYSLIKEKYYPLFERFMILRSGDAYFLKSHVTTLENYGSYMRDQRDFLRSEQLFTILYRSHEHDPDVRRILEEQLSKVRYYWSYHLYETGEYLEAYEKMKGVNTNGTVNQKYLEFSLKIALRYSTFLIEQGRSKVAEHLLDSLINGYASYPFIRESYVKSVINIVYSNNVLRDAPDEAIATLAKAYTIDPNNKSLINAIVNAHHNYARVKMKAKDYSSARDIVRKGLSYNAHDAYLLADVKYLDSVKK